MIHYYMIFTYNYQHQRFIQAFNKRQIGALFSIPFMTSGIALLMRPFWCTIIVMLYLKYTYFHKTL